MEFQQLISALTQAIVRGDGAAAAACFTDDGVYHDVFYGAFPKARIPTMVSEYFHRDASDFIWDLHEPVRVTIYGQDGYGRLIGEIRRVRDDGNCGLRLVAKLDPQPPGRPDAARRGRVVGLPDRDLQRGRLRCRGDDVDRRR